jgi:hypothetical protein
VDPFDEGGGSFLNSIASRYPLPLLGFQVPIDLVLLEKGKEHLCDTHVDNGLSALSIEQCEGGHNGVRTAGQGFQHAASIVDVFRFA